MTHLLETRRVFIAVVALGLFAMAARPVIDPDFWWHLRTGQLILHTHAVPRVDPYSFTRFGQPWTNHEWLSEVLIYCLYRAGGFAALIVGFASITAAIFLLVYMRCHGRPYVAGVLTVWAAVASVPLWGVRPQMISLLLAALVLLLRDLAQNKPRRWWWMVPLMLLWVNLHAGYALGVALLALFLLGDLLDVAFGVESWPRIAPRLRTIGLVTLACLAVVPLNPNGVKLYWYPLQTLRSASMQKYIVEWFSPNFHEAQYLPLLLFLLATFAAVAFSPKRLRPYELLLLLTTAFAALISVRHAPIFVVVTAPLLSQLLHGWTADRKTFIEARPAKSLKPAKMAVNAGLLLVVVGLTVAHIWRVARQQATTEAANFPTDAVSFLAQHHLPAPIFNHYNWGGYLIWKLYPRYSVYIDGRADVYGDAFMDEFSTSCDLRDHWKDPLDRWHIQTVMLPPDAPLLEILKRSAYWKQVYSDTRATIVTRTVGRAAPSTIQSIDIK